MRDLVTKTDVSIPAICRNASDDGTPEIDNTPESQSRAANGIFGTKAQASTGKSREEELESHPNQK